MRPYWQTRKQAGQVAELPESRIEYPLLVLGCGRRPYEGATNHNLTRIGDWVDVARDLDVPYWQSTVERRLRVGASSKLHRTEERIKGTYRTILAIDLLEHVTDVLGFCWEAWQLLEPGGLLVVRAAAYDNPCSYTDPTHLHWFNRESLDFLDPTTRWGGHYGAFYVDKQYRPLLPYYVLRVGRSNADGRWPELGDWLWLLQKADPDEVAQRMAETEQRDAERDELYKGKAVAITEPATILTQTGPEATVTADDVRKAIRELPNLPYGRAGDEQQ